MLRQGMGKEIEVSDKLELVWLASKAVFGLIKEGRCFRRGWVLLNAIERCRGGWVVEIL